MSQPLLKVFDFHPIHVFLNNECVERYESAKKHYKNYEELKNFVNKSAFGTGDFLKCLIKKCKQGGFKFLNIRDIDMKGI